MNDDLNVDLNQELQALDQDLEEFRTFYAQLDHRDKSELKRLVDEAAAATALMSQFPKLRILQFRIGFYATSSWREDDIKQPHLSVRTLRRAIDAWDKSKGYTPNVDTLVDDRCRQ
jgi:hypothetical protein